VNLKVWESILSGYILAGIPWGWSFLSRLSSRYFLFLPIIGWFLYFIFKITLSYFIGFIVMTVKIPQLAIQITKNRQNEEFMANN